MTKKFLLTTVIILILIIGYYIYSKQKLPTEAVIDFSQSTNTSYIPINILEDQNLQSFTPHTPLVFENQKSGDVVSFQGTVVEARNPGSNVYLNQEKIGIVEGKSINSPSFSSDNRFFAFRNLSICGASCYDFSVYVVDIPNKKVIHINPPQKAKDYTEQNSRLGYEVSPFLESYSWSDSGNIRISFFFIGFNGRTNETSKISPTEIWNYNLATNQYSLVQTLSE